MHYPKVLERVGTPEQIVHRSFSLGAPEVMQRHKKLINTNTKTQCLSVATFLVLLCRVAPLRSMQFKEV